MNSASLNKTGSTLVQRKVPKKKTGSSTVDLSKAGITMSSPPPTQGTLKFSDQGLLTLHPQNIAALQKIADTDLHFYANKYQQDPQYRRRMREIHAGQVQLMEDIKQGRIDLPEIEKRLNELATMNMRAHHILDDEGKFTELTKQLLLLAADVYTAKSIGVNSLSTMPNIARVGISLGLQMVKYVCPGAALGIQIAQWTVNISYCAVQFAFTVLLPVDNGVGQPACVREQTIAQPCTPNISSNEPKVQGNAVALREPKVVKARLDAVVELIERLEQSPAVQQTEAQAKAEIDATIARLDAQLLKKVNKEGQRLNALTDPTPQESAALNALGDPIAAAKALLAMKDTTRIISPKLREKLTFLLEERQFWTDLQSALTPPVADRDREDPSDSDEASIEAPATILPSSTTLNVEAALGAKAEQAPPTDPVPAALRALRARLIHSYAVMLGFGELNEQIYAGLGARRSRNYDNGLSALLSLVPNITSLTPAADLLAEYQFGVFMDMALLLSLVRQPVRYATNLPKDMAKDLESKLIRLNRLLFLQYNYAASGPDGGPDPAQLDNNMVRTVLVVLKQLEEGLKYDLQLKSQMVLSYFVDPDTLNPRKAKTVSVATVVANKVSGGSSFQRSDQTVDLACTFSRLNAHLLTRKSREARHLFIEDLCGETQASNAVRHSVFVLLEQYEDVQTALQHLANRNLADLFDDQLLTPKVQQLLAKSLMYAQYRTDLENPPAEGERRFDEHELDVICAGARELCTLIGNAESRTLMGCFQILQKQIINGYALFLAGPGGFTFLKAVSTLVATLLEIQNKVTGGQSKVSTMVKLVVNLISLIGSLTFGIVIGVAYGLFIAHKNRLRNEFKSDPNNVNIAGVSYQTLGRGIHLSLDYERQRQTHNETLVTPGVPQVQAPPIDATGDFATFFTQFLVRFRPQPTGAGQEEIEADGAPDAVRIPMEDHVERSAEEAPADDTDQSETPPSLQAPVPPLSYDNPIRMLQEFLLGTFTIVDFRKWRQYLNAKGAELAEVPQDQLPGWIQGKFDEVMALVARFEAGELSDEGTTTFEVDGSDVSERSDSQDAGSDADEEVQPLMKDLGKLRFVSYGEPFDDTERKSRVEAVVVQVQDLGKKDIKRFRNDWREQANLLRDTIEQLDAKAPLRPDYEQALEMMEEVLLEIRPSRLEQRKKTDPSKKKHTTPPTRSTPSSGAADVLGPGPGDASHASAQAALKAARQADFVSTDKLEAVQPTVEPHSKPSTVEEVLRHLGLWQDAELTSEQAVFDAAAYVNQLDASTDWHRHFTQLQAHERALAAIDAPSRLAQRQIQWTRLLLKEVTEALEDKILAHQTYV